MTDLGDDSARENIPYTTDLPFELLMVQRDKVVAEAGPSALSHYRKIVKDLPRPTADQIDNFVKFVSGAHSWYKHLPLLPPGVPFQFFIDPFSGCDRVMLPGGHVTYQERTENSQRFHYTWMTTAEYRSRFGHLSYAYSGVGTQIFFESASGVREYRDLPFFSSNDGDYRIPNEIAQIGSVELTAVIHRLTAREWVWEDFFCAPHACNTEWPRETGGDETLRKIITACARETQVYLEEGIVEELRDLLLPEKQRLQQNMTDAINRMLQLIYDEKE